MRQMMIGAIAAFGLTAGCAWAASNTGTVDIRDRMSVTQFHEAGLDKLSPQELDVLNAWFNEQLAHNTPASGAVSPAAASVTAPAASIAGFGDEQLPEKGAGQIESRIDGVLTGWTGNTLFRLENGQVWKQAGPGYETGMRLDHPRVVIKKLAFGYLLTLPGRSDSVFVRRVQ